MNPFNGNNITMVTLTKRVTAVVFISYFLTISIFDASHNIPHTIHQQTIGIKHENLIGGSGSGGRRLKAQWTIEQARDLKTMHGV